MLTRRNRRAAERRQVELQGQALAGLVDAGILAAYGDGELTDEEVEVVADVIDGFCDGQASNRDIRELLQASIDALDEHGYDAKLDSLGENLFNEELAALGVAVASAVLLADGEYNDDEDDTLYDIADAVGIDHDTADEIFTEVYAQYE